MVGPLWLRRILTQFFLLFAAFFLSFLVRTILRIVFSFRRRREKKRLEKELIHSEETILQLQKRFFSHPTEFENYIAMIFAALGYEDVTVTSKSNDGGKDIIMYKNGEKCIAEVKLYSPQYKIGREKIQKLHSACVDSDAAHAVFVTTSDFTDTAIAYAGKHGIELLNGFLLTRLIEAVSKDNRCGKNEVRYLKDYIQMNMEEWQGRDRLKADRFSSVPLFLYCIYMISYLYTVAGLKLWYLLAVSVLCMAACGIRILKLFLQKQV